MTLTFEHPPDLAFSSRVADRFKNIRATLDVLESVVVIASTCFSPQPLRDLHRIYARRFPPLLFVTTPVEIPVVNPAQRHDELVAHPPTKRARLPKSEMMGIGRTPPADQARL